MKGCLLLSLLLVVLAGCTPLSGARSTETPLPLSQVALDPLLFQPGDLPDDIISRQTSEVGPGYYARNNVPEADSAAMRWLGPPGAVTADYGDGFVVVRRYASSRDLETAYRRIGGGTARGATPIENLGERTLVAGPSPLGAGLVLFVRCGAVAHIQLGVQPNYETSVDMAVLVA